MKILKKLVVTGFAGGFLILSAPTVEAAGTGGAEPWFLYDDIINGHHPISWGKGGSGGGGGGGGDDDSGGGSEDNGHSAAVDETGGLGDEGGDAFGKNNNGHGNNADGVDVSNPGAGDGGPGGAPDPSGDVDDETKGGGKGKGGKK